MMTSLNRLLKDSSGSLALEFALILPFLLLTLFAVIELGSAWYAKQMLAATSREGARYGAIYVQDGRTNAEVRDYVLNQLTQSGFPGPATVSVTGADGASGTMVSVTIDSAYSFPVLNRLIPGVLGNIDLSSRTLMRHE
jgi:Flp pilus assembly protein TadG